MKRETYRRNWLRLHNRYERSGLAIFRRNLRETALRIPFENIETWNYKVLLEMNINDEAVRKAYQDLYYTIGLSHGKRVGKSINKQIKNFDPSGFENSFFDFVKNWLLNNGGQRIVSVKSELVQYLLQFITEGMNQGKDIRTISRELQKHILSRGFYRWQIERIVRTETTAAANLGAIQAGNATNVIWEKEWISSRNARTRRRPDDQFDHWVLDGVKVAKGEKFNVQGSMLDYPGDPKGHPGAVINCRCSCVIVAKRDSQGRIIFRDRVYND